MSLFARALSRIIQPWIACVFQQVEGGKGAFARMCVDIAVCVQWGLLIGHLEVWETTEISPRIFRTNGRAVSDGRAGSTMTRIQQTNPDLELVVRNWMKMLRQGGPPCLLSCSRAMDACVAKSKELVRAPLCSYWY